MLRNMDLREKNGEITQAKKKPLKEIKDSARLETSRWRTRLDVSLEVQRLWVKEDEIVVQKRASLGARYLLFSITVLESELLR